MNITEIVKSAIREDIKDIGDITANSLLPENHKSQARIFAKQDGVCAGINYAVETLKQFNLDFTVNKNDGDILNIGDTIITISGTTRNILTTERTILNFIGHLSGVATTTNKAVKIAKPHNVIFACTRKTTLGYEMLKNML